MESRVGKLGREEDLRKGNVCMEDVAAWVEMCGEKESEESEGD